MIDLTLPPIPLPEPGALVGWAVIMRSGRVSLYLEQARAVEAAVYSDGVAIPLGRILAPGEARALVDPPPRVAIIRKPTGGHVAVNPAAVSRVEQCGPNSAGIRCVLHMQGGRVIESTDDFAGVTAALQAAS